MCIRDRYCVHTSFIYAKSVNKIFQHHQSSQHAMLLRFALFSRGENIVIRKRWGLASKIIFSGLNTFMCTYTLRAHLMPSFSDLFQNVGLTSFLFAVQHCTAYRMPTSPSRLAGQRLSVSGLTKATNNLSLPAVKSTCSASSLYTTQSGRKYCDTQALSFGVQIIFGLNTPMCTYRDSPHFHLSINLGYSFGYMHHCFSRIPLPFMTLRGRASHSPTLQLHKKSHLLL